MPNKLRAFFTGMIIILGYLFNSASAQDLPGKKDSLYSAILKEKRYIQVVLPEKYKPGLADKYDVLYVLDGDGNIKMASDVQRFLEGESFMPSTIIVAISNTDRDRDFTPTHVKDNKTSGGADKFLEFMKTELIPYVNKTYPSNGDNTIFGHSYGGLFVTYALLNQPQLFKSYIAADPSFWWGKAYMKQIFADKLAGLGKQGITFYISGRAGDGMQQMGITPIDTILQKKAPANLNWKVVAYADETHGSIRLKSIYDGLKFTYGGYSPKGIEFHPMNGIVQKGKPIKVWYFDDLSRIRYTTDGTEPIRTSAQMQSEITLDGPATVTIKRFTNREQHDNNTRSGNFKEGTPMRAASSPKNLKPGGFSYHYYEGNWDKLPDFTKLKAVQSGITDKNFDLNKLPSKTNFGLVVYGQLEVKEDGYYVFGVRSDDGSKLYLGNKLLIDNDGVGDKERLASYILPLKKGFYPLRLEYYQKDGGHNLQLVYLTPATIASKQAVPIPLELQYGQ